MKPRYVTFVMLFEPRATAASLGQRMAGLNAAPTTAKLIERIAPLLGVVPRDGGDVRGGVAGTPRGHSPSRLGQVVLQLVEGAAIAVCE